MLQLTRNSDNSTFDLFLEITVNVKCKALVNQMLLYFIFSAIIVVNYIYIYILYMHIYS